jgi:hypothetical protein|tara:strand:+ start:2162 stop:2677 length:516 start_codon:yes stop_codon:yes gene_type:complete
MACNISAGRLEGCKDSVGGLNAIYFINYGAPEGFAVTDETITGVTATTPSAFKYDLKGTSTFDQSLTSSRDNGTTFAEQTLTVSLKKQDATTHKEVKLLAYGRPHIIIEDNNGLLWVMGEEFGVEMNATTSTGASLGDKSGYELVFAGMEKGLAKSYVGVLATDFAITVGA